MKLNTNLTISPLHTKELQCKVYQWQTNPRIRTRKESRQRTEFSVKLGLDLATDCLEIGPTDEKRGKKKTTLETWQVPKLQLTTTEHQKGGGGATRIRTQDGRVLSRNGRTRKKQAPNVRWL